MLTEIHEIQKLRRQAGLTQQDLAKRAGVSQSLIAKLEAGRIDPSFSKAKKLFEALSATKPGMVAEEIMNRSLLTAAPHDSLKRSIDTMKRHGISQLPVLDDRKVVGLVSESTILDALISEKKATTHVELVMDDAPPIVTKKASIDTVTQLLKEYPIVLVSEKGKLLGHITKADVLMKAYR
jgi:predicted transcriptional regulator